MAVDGWMWSVAISALALTTFGTFGGSDILPYDADDASVTDLSDLHQSLTALEGVLRDKTTCQDRLKILWEDLAKSNVTMSNDLDKMLEALDQLSPILNSRKAHACGQNFSSFGGSCLHRFESVPFEWWRSRFYCWLKGGELVDPADIQDLEGFLPKENGMYWIGASSPPQLKFPKWTTIYGERLLSNQENFTTLPRDKPDENCLAVDSGTLEIHTRNCNLKSLSVCQERSPGCSDPFHEVGRDCYAFHEGPLTWADARSQCEKDGGQLAKVADFDAAQKFVEKHIETKFWNVWIGAKRDSATSSLKWLDKSVVNLTTHGHDQELSDGDCLALTPGSFQSRGVACNVELPFVCIM